TRSSSGASPAAPTTPTPPSAPRPSKDNNTRRRGVPGGRGRRAGSDRLERKAEPSARLSPPDRQDGAEVVPAAADARLDDVGGELVAPAVELGHLLGRRHAAAVRRQAGTEDVGDQAQGLGGADRALGGD